MWSRFARLALLLALGAAGCGPRQLAVTLRIDASACTLSLPAGGSILYQVNANGSTGDGGGGPGSFCGGCLEVDTAIGNADALIAFLRQRAPSCAGVHPGTLLGVRVTGWSAAACPTAAPAFCVDGPTVIVPDGSRDGTVALQLACHAQCATECVPMSCMEQGKDCGPISDGCNHVLDCGSCKPPARCAGTGVPNVCGR
jgi:hypothetical protein